MLGVFLLFFLNASEETVMKLAGVLVNGLWFLWGSRMLVNPQANPEKLYFFGLFSGRTNWKRPRIMRAPQRAPSQCNISEQTLPLHCVFITDEQFTKKAKIIQEGGQRRSSDTQRLNSSSVVTDSAPALCIFLLPGTWNQDYWENMTLSSWHFCTLHRFFSLNYKRKKNQGRKTKSKGFLFRRRL